MPTDTGQPANRGRCPNCSAVLSGPYCAACGQRQTDLDRPLRALLGEAMDAFLSFDARLLRTLVPLITRPGFLTMEFFAGRRRSYVHPFKLYLALSVAYFFALSMWGHSVVRMGGDDRLVVGTSSSMTGGEGEATRNEISVDTEAPSFFEASLDPLFRLMESDPARLNQIFIDRLAKSVIILVPVFAMLLRMLYWARPYVVQLVFSLYLHSFAFLAILAGMALDVAFGTTDGGGPGDVMSVVAIAVHTFLGLRRVQGQRRLLTVAKMVVLLAGYLVALLLTMVLTLMLTAVTV